MRIPVACVLAKLCVVLAEADYVSDGSEINAPRRRMAYTALLSSVSG
jgi:hypothetical protein